MKTLAKTAAYDALRKKVEGTLLLGQQKIEEAKLRTYHETGRLIDQHIRDHTSQGKKRAAYGEDVMGRLAEDLKVDLSVLKRVRKFFQLFPKGAARHLSWAHYRALIAVPDEKKRLALADKAAKGEWTSRDLEIEVRNLNWKGRAEASDGKSPSVLAMPTLGPFFTYKIIRPEIIHSKSNELLIDLGFSTVLELNRVSDGKFAPDTIVTSSKDAKGRYTLKETGSPVSETRSQKGGEAPPYTYQAFVERIIDGDTLKVEIDLGFNIRIRQTIRLRAIDCPEMYTQEGVAAKRFVERELAPCELITVRSTQTRKEKWGRYLGDVFCTDKAGNEVYLNNLLLEKQHAVRVRE